MGMPEDGWRRPADLLRHPAMKRGQGISINVVVVTAIALIVLLVLIVIFMNRGALFQKGLNQCSGECVAKGTPCPADKPVAVPSGNCDDGVHPPVRDGACCVSI